MAESRTERSGGDGFSIARYFREVRIQMSKVTWPTREAATRWTGIVLLITAVMTAILSTFDSIFSTGLRILVDTFLGVN